MLMENLQWKAHSKYQESTWVDADIQRLQDAGLKAYRLPNSYKNLNIYGLSLSQSSDVSGDHDVPAPITEESIMTESQIQALSTETIF